MTKKKVVADTSALALLRYRYDAVVRERDAAMRDRDVAIQCANDLRKTARDHFAGCALTACGDFGPEGPLSWITRLWHGDNMDDDEIAASCYAMADAMLAEREKEYT